MNIKSFVVVAGLLLSLNVQAEGISSNAQENGLVSLTSQLISPALWKIDPDVFTCSLTNVTSQSHAIRIRIIHDGVTLKDSGKVSLAAKTTKGIDFESLPAPGYLYCEFTVDGLKGWYRGVAKMYHVDGGDFIAVAAE